jgi:hypothetical protein
VTWFAWVSALAGSSSGEAALLQALIAENMPGYEPQRWHLTLIMWALLISSGLINTYTFWLVPWLELASGILHVILFVIFMIVLLVLSPKSTSDFVWSSSSVLSGWDGSSFVAFNLGMLVPAWGFIGAYSNTSSYFPFPTRSPGALDTYTPSDSDGNCLQASTASCTCPKKSAARSTPCHGP